MKVSKALEKHSLDEEEKKNTNKLFKDLYEDRDVYIDPDIADLVHTVNSRGVNTRESCSGTFSDHFDVGSLKNDVSFDELSSWMRKDAYISSCLPHAFLSTSAFMHSFQDDGSVLIQDGDDFYVNLFSDLSANLSDLDRYIRWNISVDSRSHYYSFSVPMKIKRYMLQESDSFEEFDNLQRKLIDTLEEAIVKYS